MTRRAEGAFGPRRASPRERGASAELGGEQIEGRQAVRELLRARRRAVEAVYLDTNLDASPIVTEIGALARAAGVLRLVGTRELDELARTESHQGVVARASAVGARPLAELARGNGTVPFLVVFDGVTDPHNLGACLRSALGAGATGAVVSRHRSAHLSPAAAKAAAGAIEHLAISLVPGIPAALAELRASGVWTVGLDAEGDREVDDLPVATEPVALVVGAEGKGLSPLARERCDLIARIPMHGPLDSLNVSVATAVACFAIARARRTSA